MLVKAQRFKIGLTKTELVLLESVLDCSRTSPNIAEHCQTSDQVVGQNRACSVEIVLLIVLPNIEHWNIGMIKLLE